MLTFLWFGFGFAFCLMCQLARGRLAGVLIAIYCLLGIPAIATDAWLGVSALRWIARLLF